MEASLERDTALDAGKVGYLVGDLVPGAVILFGGCFRWRIDAMPLGVRRVEVDHLQVRMEGFQDNFAGHPRRQWSDSCENGSRHDEFSS